MTQLFELTFQQKNFLSLLLRNNHYDNEYRTIDGKETFVRIYSKEIPRNTKIKKIFFNIIDSLRAKGIIADTCEVRAGQLSIYIKDELLRGTEKTTKIVLTDFEKKFYSTFVRQPYVNNSNGTVKVCYKNGIQGMTAQQLGATMTRMKQKGLILSVDTNKKIAIVKVL